MHRIAQLASMIAGGLVAAFLLVQVPALHAHPFHVSIAEVEYNAETQHLEVALRVAPEDLERALTARTEKRVRLERTENVDSLIIAYLNDVFVLRTVDEERQPLEWVGKEVSVKAVWLYFEFPFLSDMEGATLSNRIFFELESLQVNTVNLRFGETLHTLTFTHAESEHRLSK